VTPAPDPRLAEAAKEERSSLADIDTAHLILRKKLAAELREAASHAREFAQPLKSPELKESFLRLATKWEAEAHALDAAL
jgi:hypothetical protein